MTCPQVNPLKGYVKDNGLTESRELPRRAFAASPNVITPWI
jgi:hypothetical protein